MSTREFVQQLGTIKPFMSAQQFEALLDACLGAEREFFVARAAELAKLVATMPQTYEQDGAEDPLVYLHYFLAGSDWYILEKERGGGLRQAFGYAILNGDQQNAELGYISIQAITAAGAELDLHFSPTRLSKIKEKKYEHIYRQHGYDSRDHYLQSLAEQYDVPLSSVRAAADLLGPGKDFDGLVSTIWDLHEDGINCDGH